MPAPWSIALAPANGTADTRSACAISAAPTARPSWARAETRQAASPAACGAAMLVPPLISLPVSQRGTDENASPGVTMSGFARSPPRELHQPTTSAAGGAPPCAGRANAPGKTAPTDSARSAEPGKPMVDNPGPSLPALMAKTTVGCRSRNAFTMESITARPSRSFPTPKLRLSTRGSPRCSAKRAAYIIARSMLPFTEMPPRALLAILRPMSCAPGATPSKPATLNRLWPAAIPATWVPWPPLSNTKSSAGTPFVSSRFAARVMGCVPRAIVSRPWR